MGNGAGVSRTAADESSWICKLPENVTRLKLRTILGILYDEGVFREHCRGNKDQNGDEFVARKVLQATCCGISHAEVFFANLVNFRTIRKSLDAAASGIPNFNDVEKLEPIDLFKEKVVNGTRIFVKMCPTLKNCTHKRAII